MSDSSATPSSGGRTGRVNHGLDEATSLKVGELAKEKIQTMPPRAQIPDDAQYCVSIGGQVLAKCCRHFGWFVKGASAHFTKDHTDTRNLFRYSGSASPPPAESAARNQEAIQSSVRWTSPPAVPSQLQHLWLGQSQLKFLKLLLMLLQSTLSNTCAVT